MNKVGETRVSRGPCSCDRGRRLVRAGDVEAVDRSVTVIRTGELIGERVVQLEVAYGAPASTVTAQTSVMRTVVDGAP